MKIIHHFTHIDEAGGGVPRSVLDLSRLLAEVGHHVSVLTSSESTFPEEWQANSGVRVIGVDGNVTAFGHLSKSARAVVKTALEQHDVAHLHGLWRPRNARIAALARTQGVPYVVSPHGMLSRWSMGQSQRRKALYLRLVEQRALRGASLIHATAQGEKEQILEWIPSVSIEVVPVAVDLSAYQQTQPESPAQTGDQAGDGRILFISRLHKKKGCEIAIDAIGLLKNQGFRGRLWIAGDGTPAYTQALIARAASQGLQEQVEFLGPIFGEEKRALYRKADVMVLPTYQENFGIVLAESMVSGTPVITTRGTDIWPEIEASGGGVIVEQSVEGFAQAIGDLLADRSRLTEMGDLGRRAITRWLDPERVVNQYARMYGRAVLSS